MTESFSYFDMLILEAVLLAAVLLLAYLQAAPVRRAVEKVGALTARPTLMIATPGLILLMARLALLPVFPFPGTVGRDESSMILGAETLLNGRFALPPHPMPKFFESVYVNHIDAYGTIYFPGRILELALGLGLFGSAGLGSLVVAALAACAITWALMAWVSPKWALVGGLLFVFRFGLFGMVVNQPIGLASMTLGGALLIGSHGRLREEITLGASLALAAGLFLLAISRPFEGFMFALPLAAGLLVVQRKLLLFLPRWPAASLFVPVLASTVLAVIVIGTFSHAGTGSPTIAPYSIHREAYAGTPTFWPQEATAATRDIPAHLARFYTFEGARYFSMQEMSGLARAMAGKLVYLWSYFVGVLFLAPFLVGLWAMRRRPEILLAIASFFAGFSLLQFSWPHYGLPLLATFLMIILRGLERLDAAGGRLALFARLLVPASFLLLAVPAWLLATGEPERLNTGLHSCCYLDAPNDRDAIAAQVKQLSGRHIVFVSYDPEDPPFTQWVFNGADLYDAKVLWVNDLGPEENQRLMKFYPDRRYWRLEGVRAEALRALAPDGAPIEGQDLPIAFITGPGDSS